MDIRPFQAEDENTVIALWESCSLFTKGHESDSRGHIQEKIGNRPDLFLVGLVDGQIIATAIADYSVDRQEGFLRYVAVAPKHRRRGHARLIISVIEELLLKSGCLRLHLDVGASRYPAIQCYSRMGYVVRTVNMHKKLLQNSPCG